ncbi:leucine carboxyl methyltransferase [Calocera cornea HHB12733]|uniref:Leucine carboxyl methyltransferase 1 n=1 Tax=Calocera cornea HHB12733 TaxID=1353952 RepID=A0A165H0T3_9BASI|nr:leucine carboxyl methyltransferase [Calocera cornea HHB12733]
MPVAPSHPATFSLPNTDPDSATRSTDTDASHARLSAARLGYLPDPFAPLFVTRPAGVSNRPGIINVGTWLRTRSVDELVEQFVARTAGEGEAQVQVQVQVLSVGAGSDTRFWRLATGPLKDKIARYVEVDFPEITASKARSIYKHRELKDVLGECTLGGGGTSLHSAVYTLLPVDLRQPPSTALAALTTPAPAPPGSGARAPLLSRTLPTLVLAECVLPYMPPQAGEALLAWAAGAFGGAGVGVGVVLYEMFGLGDAFGGVMRENLAARGIRIPGTLPSLAALQSRFTSAGYARSSALTLQDIRTHYVPPSETERVAQLELIDEWEELDLVLRHYCVAWASRGLEGEGGLGWGLQKAGGAAGE